jgi:CDP-diacylglycerol--glycerol-3-phosphate 3-phosphatidyltransferase
MDIAKHINLPNILTLSRLVLSPLFLPFLFVYLLPLNLVWLNFVLAIFFLLFSLTDFFDGYLARRFQQVTKLGKILDPIADKSLMYSTLISLLAVQKIYFYWVVLFIGREFFVMGLRLVALEHYFSVPVSVLGKIKTMFQVMMLMVIIMNPYQGTGFVGPAGPWNIIESLLIVVTLLVSLWSAKRYYNDFIVLYNAAQLAESPGEL